MAKLKNHSGAAKRFKQTGTGTYRHKQACSRHKLTKKGATQKRNLRGTADVQMCDSGLIKQMLPL